MSLVKIVIDGDTLVDKDVGEWTNSLPELQKYVQPGAKPEPWMMALLIVLTPSLARGEGFSAQVTTHTEGWTLNVNQGEPDG